MAYAPSHRAHGIRGFTLIEALLCVGSALVLIGLLLPVLSGSRESARRAVCARQIASHMQVVGAYAIDYQGYFPYYFSESRRIPPMPPGGRPPAGEGLSWWYGAAGALWHLPVLDAYNGDPFHESLICPSDRFTLVERDEHAARLGVDPRSLKGTLLYVMSMAMYLDPKALSPDHPSWDPAYFVPQRQGDVVFPSQKAALYEAIPFHDPAYTGGGSVPTPHSTNVAGADGAVSYRNSTTIHPGVPLRAGTTLPGAPEPGLDAALREAAKLRFTANGVRGRDW